MQDRRVFGRALEQAIASLRDELGKSDRERLDQLVALAAKPEILLADCLGNTFGAKDEAVLESLKTFQEGFNRAAAQAKCGLHFEVDDAAASLAGIQCWFVDARGPDPAERAAAFSAESIASTKSEPQVSARALSLSGSQLEKRHVRLFVSYAHLDNEHPFPRVFDLLGELDKLFEPSRHYRIDPWTDHQILMGEKWDQEIQRALRECDFGLLMVSPSFLSRKYIREVELPVFVGGPDESALKPLLPVGLAPVDFQNHDLCGLEDHQVFRGGMERRAGKFFSELGNRRHRERFAKQLFEAIITRLDKHFTSSIATPVAVGAKVPDAALPLRQLAETWGREQALDLPKHFQPTRGVPTRTDILECIERKPGDLDRDAVDALGTLAEWATSIGPDTPPFHAVLGEYGIGKTTTLKQLTQHLLERRKRGEDAPVPIYIDLRLDVASRAQVPTLEELLAEVIRRNSHLSGSATLTPADILFLVRTEGALLIFDGLDEKIVHLGPSDAQAFIRELWKALPAVVRQRGAAGGKRPGRMILSCRSHYFRDVVSQNAMLTGEGREGLVGRRDYRVLLLLPFNEAQIRGYLRSALGSEAQADQAFNSIESIYNLRDLAERPVLLAHLTERIEELEQLRAAGETVNAARLYELVVQRWLARDDGKHQLDPQHKRLLMERLAADMTASGAREWEVDRLEEWFDEFLAAEPVFAGAYAGRPRELLKEDLRAATFMVRPEMGPATSVFRFAHTSLQEFFLAAHLRRALKNGWPKRWKLEGVSEETLNFLGQMIALKPNPETLRAWEDLLTAGEIVGGKLAFRLWLRARAQPRRRQLGARRAARRGLGGHAVWRPR